MKRKYESEPFFSSKKTKITLSEEARIKIANDFMDWQNSLSSADAKDMNTLFQKVSLEQFKLAFPNFELLKSCFEKFKFKNGIQIVEYVLRALFKNDHPYFMQIIKNLDDIMYLLAMVRNTEGRPSRKFIYSYFPQSYIQQLSLSEMDSTKIDKLEQFVEQVVQHTASRKNSNKKGNANYFHPSSQCNVFPTTEDLKIAYFMSHMSSFLQPASTSTQLFNQPDYFDEEPVLATVVTNKNW